MKDDHKNKAEINKQLFGAVMLGGAGLGFEVESAIARRCTRVMTVAAATAAAAIEGRRLRLKR